MSDEIEFAVHTFGPWKQFGGWGADKRNPIIVDSLPDVDGKCVANAPLYGIVLLPCPFCGVVGRCGPDGAYYFQHAQGCWIEAQRGTMLDCVSWEELDQWNARSDREDAEKWRAMQRSMSRPDLMRNDVTPVWDSRNVGQ